ncbi:MAG: hypothetical protein QOD77_283 [Thermoplasmata archaeon]|jgi:hypothetical protein|nr:hypothetical protein [Thermoplasmata archaeon]
MTTPTPQRLVPDLHALLPTVHKLEDARLGGPLQALLDVMSAQGDLVRRDIELLWDNLFIDTCADWVVPYIGDLVGTRPLHDVDQARRRDVARTIGNRRRKGVLPMLEQLAKDVTGWQVHAVAEFERLAWTQHLEHVRSQGPPLRWSMHDDPTASLVAAAEVRDADLMDRVGGPFDQTARTIDVRHAVHDRVRPHVRNVTFHAEPHKALEVKRVLVHPVELPAGHPHHGRAFRIGHLGADFPLFAQANPPVGLGDPDPTLPPFLPGSPLRPLAVHIDVEQARRRFMHKEGGASQYIGPDRSLQFWFGAAATPAHEIHVMDLSDWGTVTLPDNTLASRVPTKLRYVDRNGKRLRGKPPKEGVQGPLLPILQVDLALDVTTGRIIQRSGARRMRVTYQRGVAAPLGGGTYHRDVAEPRGLPWQVSIPQHYTSLGTALNAWEAARDAELAQGRHLDGLIELDTNGVRDAFTSIQLAPGCELVLRAADLRWPHFRGPLHIHGAKDAKLTLDGVCIQDQLRIDGEVELLVRHSALVPGLRLHGDGSPAHPLAPSIVPGPKLDLRLRIEHSVVGPLRLPPEAATVEASDSILQAPEPTPGEAGVAFEGPPLRLERCTVFGTVQARTLHASETLFVDPVVVERRQEECVRFSHVPEGSLTPRRFRCQPDLAVAALGDAATPADKARLRARIAPVFLSRRYGHPDHARLHPETDPAVREGAEDGGEMGAHHLLHDPHREQNLDARMEEYLPLGRRHTLATPEARP